MKLRIIHKTVYEYGDPVSTSHHEARLAPRDEEWQQTLFHEIVIVPSPSVRRERLDFFGNRALHFSLREPHRSMELTATSLVDRVAPPPLLAVSPAWEQIQARIRSDHRRDILDGYAFTFESVHVRADADLVEYALPSFPPGRPLLEGVRDLTRRIRADFVYDPRATEVSTPVVEVLRRRRGVCQDFAHLQIACLRSLGLAARYVSGYLLSRPPPGKPRLIGADASHAWIAAYVPDLGWVDFDPTNDLIPGDEHITVAYGRDFADVTPLKGVILGGGRHKVAVSVDVEAIG